MNNFWDVLPIFILSFGIVVLSLNCMWLSRRIDRLDMKVFRLEHPHLRPHFDHTHYDTPQDRP